MTDFCHLHVHTEYSQLDGLGSPERYAERASRLGFKYLGITDHANIDGLIKFQKACQQHDIKPVLGCELYIIPELDSGKNRSRKRGHVCVYVKNQKGFSNLCKLLTFANLECFYHKPRVTYQKLLDHCEGLVISTACMSSFIRVFENGKEFFEDLKDSLDKDLYCEIMPYNHKIQVKVNKLKIKLAKRYDCKVIATNDCHYIKRLDHRAHEVLLAIQRKAKWDDPKRWRFEIRDLHLRTEKEMVRGLKKLGFYKKKYLLNTLEIAEKCSGFRIPKKDVRLPRIKGVPVNPKKERKFLLDLCKQGYKNKWDAPIKSNKEYNDRLKEEYELIVKKKFNRYILIVWDLIRWCRENSILIGPGRGSVGGSLMCYLLGITSVDPIEHNLMFSRFYTEDRIDHPDIDIDFEHTKRHLVKSYLESTYGKGKVAGVSSFNRMHAKAVVKDVGRVFGVHHSETNEFTKLIEDTRSGDDIQNAIDSWDEAREFEAKYPKVIKFAKALEGTVRGYSQHAAALVISRDKIKDSGRCNLLQRKDTTLVNWEKDDTEYAGFIKFDFLGLKLLSVLSEAKRLIKENRNVEFKFEELGLEDKTVLKEVSGGNTIGIFQLGTYATTNLIKEMGVEEFNHISDAIALVRPGPTNSGMTKEYIKRKHGSEWEKKHRVYEKITKNTYGVIVYQEQVMEVISRVAGLPYATSYNIRKIIGKKRDPKEFRQYKKQFLEGCKKTKYFDKMEAKEFWGGLQEHAKYSFNKSHSVEYAMLGYWCAYLKKYYPTEFICASLTYCAKDKKKNLVEESYRLGLNIVLPKVAQSDPYKWIAKGSNLYIPFTEVEGIGPVKAKEASTLEGLNKSNIKTFFSKKGSKKEKPRHKGALGKLLENIGAYSQDPQTQIDDNVKNYFKFRVVANPKKNYANLFELFKGKLRLDHLDLALNGDYSVLKGLSKRVKVFKKRKFKGHKKLISCTKCSLREECTTPVPPSPGQLNIVALAEAPGPQEDSDGEGLVGPSGQTLWKALGKKYPRTLFHVSNCNKCWPQKSRKPNKKQITTCGKLFLDSELKRVKPAVILAFGNTPLYFFTGKNSGITGISGKVEWNEEYSAWIVWCIHPAAVLHNPENQIYFKAGIKQFKKTLRALGIKDLI